MSDMMRWDLGQLVQRDDEASIIKNLGEMTSAAEVLHDKYAGKMTHLGASGLHALLEAMDEFFLKFEGPMSYAMLRYSADSTDQVSKRLHDAARNASVKTGQALAFFELELGALLKEHRKLPEHELLAEYRHFLERVLLRAPHVLSETEEKLVMAKDLNGTSAWSQLQGDWLATRTFRIKVKGEEKELPYGEIISFYSNPDRELRREANRIVYHGLGKDEIIWSSAIRAVCADHLTMCQWRKYPTPMSQSLLSNDVEAEAVKALMSTIEKHVGLYRRYLNFKAKLMGLPKLGNWDVIAPLPGLPDRSFTWDESRSIVVQAYSKFDPEFGHWVEEMFDQRHIDAEVRKGKVSGAFCNQWLVGKGAYVLQSFNGRMTDVYTQAHELGHAVHAYLYSRAQQPCNADPGSCIAECGSIFGELLLTDQLLSSAKTKEERRAVLAVVLDEFGMAAFQVSARVWFEQGMYDAISAGRFLDGETVSELWTGARDRIYGDAMEWLPEMKWEWTMKLHYYIPNYRFYNYPYVFAQLFVFALYRLYQEQGVEFAPKLRSLLAAGSSRSPQELAQELGFDLSSEEFWEKGMLQAEEFLAMLEATL